MVGIAICRTQAADPQDFLPPALPWHGASERLIAKADDSWITPSEKTGLTDSPGYDETIGYLKKLAAASPLLSLQEFGRTGQGRVLYVVLAAKASELTPEGLRTGGKPILLAQAGIHSGEIDGKDAGLMLLRDIAFRGKGALLDGANFLFVPIFNADGHERSSEWNRPNQRGPIHQGWRTTAQNLNLNRDYMKADSPEMQAMLALIRKWSPTLYLDLHVTDGIDYQYDITFGFNGERGVPAWSPRIGAWLDDVFRPSIEAALRDAGHIPGPLIFARNDRDLSQGLALSPSMPRFSNGYGDLRHLPAVLVENHSLKPYRQRVLGTYIFVESSLRTLASQHLKLREAIAADQNARPEKITVNWIEGGGRTNKNFAGVAYELYDSPASGGKEVRWLGTPKTYANLPVYFSKAGLHVTRPKAYWVPVTKPEVIARLKLHGIEMETLSDAETVRVSMYRLINPKPEPGEGFHPFESRHTLKTSVKVETRTETFPAGSVRVLTDQPLGELAVALLEPQSGDSLFAWGFFPEILQRTEYIEGYALAPLADRMLRDDPKVKAEFEAKLAADPKFAADSSARL
ncbi:MAG TPA: M14 family metallopeptidase, partial [Verrucomicrobiae bacterium]|nr:M14 family metallopeptidase [Verrucomicrobiae bacterium]